MIKTMSKKSKDHITTTIDMGEYLVVVVMVKMNHADEGRALPYFTITSLCNENYLNDERGW